MLSTVLSSLYLYCPLPNKATLQGFSVVPDSWQGGEGQQEQEFFHGALECPVFPAFLVLLMALSGYFLQSWAPHFTRLTGSSCRICYIHLQPAIPGCWGAHENFCAPIRLQECAGHHCLKSVGQWVCVVARKPKQRRSIQMRKAAFLILVINVHSLYMIKKIQGNSQVPFLTFRTWKKSPCFVPLTKRHTLIHCSTKLPLQCLCSFVCV